MAENYVKFRRGTADQFNALTQKDTDTLYFITKNGKTLIYLGPNLVGVDESEFDLGNLANVDINLGADPSQKDGYVLTYDAETDKWVAAVNPGSSGAVGDLADEVTAIDQRLQVVEGDYVTTQEMNTAINNKATEINTNLTTNYYTKEQAEEKIAEKVASLDHLKRKTFNSIEEATNFCKNPGTENPQTYILMVAGGTEDNKYSEYMYFGETDTDGDPVLELIGAWEVNLDEYVTNTELTTQLNDYAKTADIVNDYVTKDELTQKNYATKDEIPTDYLVEDDLDGYAKTADLNLSQYLVASEFNATLVNDTTFKGEQTKLSALTGRVDNLEQIVSWKTLT